MDGFAGAVGGPPGGAGQRAYVTVLFSDLCGSTGLAAELDADSYAELLEAIRAEGRAIIDLFGGQVAQVYGDGMLSIFEGAGGAMRAAEAAVRLHRAVAALPPPQGAPGGGLRMHSGIHSGLVLLRAGDAVRGTIEAVGRTTAVAARLSAAARADEILVSAGSLGPMRGTVADGPGRLVDVGDGSDPVRVLAVRKGVDGARPASAPEERPADFVGRDAELRRCAGWLDGLQAGRGFRALLVAPAGQGKTRLSREIGMMADDRGIAVLRGTCSRAADVGPLQPFRQVAMQLDEAGPAELDPDALPVRIGELLARQPLLMVLDDWQWADAASVAVLAKIRALEGPLGLLLLARDEAGVRVPMEGFAELQLPPLTLAETTALVARRRPEFDPLDAARVHARAGGNPLFVEEICLLDPRTARQMLPDGMEPAGMGWVASLVAARVRRLPPEAQAVLETAAVIGMTPPGWLLAEMVGDAVAARALPVLEANDLLLREPAGLLGFKHGITWQIVYSLVPLSVRRRLHAAIAAVLQARGPEREPDLQETLAWHLLASDQPALGWRHAVQAGDRAAAIGSLDRARIQYGRALEALARLPGDALDRAGCTELVRKFGYVCVYDADAEQIPLFEAAITRAEAWGDREGQAEAHYWLGYVAHGSGNSPLAIRHCRLALALSALPEDSSFKVQLRAVLGQALAGAARYAEAAPLLDEAIAIKRAGRSGRRASPGLAYTLAQRAALFADRGAFGEAGELMAEALETLRGEQHPVEGSVLAWKSVVHGWQGDWEAMVAAAARGCEIAQRTEAVYVHAICRAFANFGRWQLEGRADAVEGLASAVDCMVDRGKTMALSIACGFLADAAAATGDAEGARRAVIRSYVRARAGDPLGLGWASRAWAREVARQSPARAGQFLARARRNAELRESAPELARCDLAEARLALLPAAERGRLAARAEEAFARLGMARLAAEARAERMALADAPALSPPAG